MFWSVKTALFRLVITYFSYSVLQNDPAYDFVMNNTLFECSGGIPKLDILVFGFWLIDLTINYVVVKSKAEINVLGVLFDSKMNWTKQVAQSFTKTKKSLHAIKIIENTNYDSKTKDKMAALLSKIIQKPKVGLQMVETKWQSFCSKPIENLTFPDRTYFDHSKSGLFWFLDTHCIVLLSCSRSCL